MNPNIDLEEQELSPKRPTPENQIRKLKEK
jgi:hypothetical protein